MMAIVHAVFYQQSGKWICNAQQLITVKYDAIMLGEYPLVNKKEIKQQNKVKEICNEQIDGYVSKSIFHDLLYEFLDLFESAIDKKLHAAEIKWLSWMLEWVFEGGLTQEQNGMLPKIKTERGKLEYVCSEMYVAFQSCQNQLNTR